MTWGQIKEGIENSGAKNDTNIDMLVIEQGDTHIHISSARLSNSITVLGFDANKETISIQRS